METKICSKCKKEKPVSEFGKNKAKKDGLHAKSVNLPIINFITRRTRRLIWQKLEKVQKNVKITLEK